MKVYMTEDGYRFFVLSNGKVADSKDEQSSDMVWDSLEEFLESTDHTAIEITNKGQ